MEELFHQNQTEIKKKLREKIRAQIRTFSPEEKARSDARIFRAVLSLPLYQRAKVIFVYVSLDWEIDTRALIQDALLGGKTVAVPKCLPGGRMEVYRLKDFHQLKAQTLGILEPGEDMERMTKEQLELALIPCLSCTKDGIRLGQGGGIMTGSWPVHHGLIKSLCAGRACCRQISLARSTMSGWMRF